MGSLRVSHVIITPIKVTVRGDKAKTKKDYALLQ